VQAAGYTAGGMVGRSGQYSSDGRWWWDSIRWVPVSSPGPESSGRLGGVDRGPLTAVIALTAVLFLVVGGLGGLLAVTRVPALQAIVPLPGTGSPATLSSLTRTLTSSAFECSRGYTSPVEVWFCFQTRAHDYADVGIQARGQDGLGYITVQVARDSGSDPDPRAHAIQLFEQLAGSLVDGPHAGQAQAWVASSISSSGGVSHQFGTAQLQVQQGADANQQPMYELDASLANTQKKSIDAPDLNGVSEPEVQRYYEATGMTCEKGTGRTNCSQPGVDVDYSGTIYTESGGNAVKFFFAGLTPHSGDQTARARDMFQGAIRIALNGDDATRTIAWVDGHLDGRSHDVVVKGVHVGVYPGQDGTSLRQGGELELWLGAWSW
jgi:hypothetical protein